MTSRVGGFLCSAIGSSAVHEELQSDTRHDGSVGIRSPFVPSNSNRHVHQCITATARGFPAHPLNCRRAAIALRMPSSHCNLTVAATARVRASPNRRNVFLLNSVTTEGIFEELRHSCDTTR